MLITATSRNIGGPVEFQCPPFIELQSNGAAFEVVDGLHVWLGPKQLVLLLPGCRIKPAIVVPTHDHLVAVRL